MADSTGGGPMVLEQEFNQAQIVAVLGMFLAGLHSQNPNRFEARFELFTDFKDDESGGLEFRGKITLVELPQ